MVFNATFNNILDILWRSALMVEEPWRTGKNSPTCRKSPTNFITSPWSRFELTTFTSDMYWLYRSFKSNYHTITSTAALIPLSIVHTVVSVLADIYYAS